MTTLVLVGFSCSGKTTISNALAESVPGLDRFDTDEWVAKHNGVEHIWELPYRYGRRVALQRIAQSERFFLRTHVADGTQIIAAGPFVPTHTDDWERFVTRTDAKVVLITISPAEATKRLLKRRQSMIDDTAINSDHPMFGSWDDGVTTERLTPDGSWTLRSQTDSEDSVTDLIASLRTIYQATPGGLFATLDSQDATAVETLRSLLEP